MSETLFLTPLLASCGVIAAFLGVRHQHLSSLIRGKEAQLALSTRKELKPTDIKNIMTQVILFRQRNQIVKNTMLASLVGGEHRSSSEDRE